jgi:hypothetical protein
MSHHWVPTISMILTCTRVWWILADDQVARVIHYPPPSDVSPRCPVPACSGLPGSSSKKTILTKISFPIISKFCWKKLTKETRVYSEFRLILCFAILESKQVSLITKQTSFFAKFRFEAKPAVLHVSLFLHETKQLVPLTMSAKFLPFIKWEIVLSFNNAVL